MREQLTQLREFGLLISGVTAVLFGSLIPYIKYQSISAPALYTALLLLILAVLYPIALSPFYRVWMKLGHVLGWLNSRILLSIIFYGLFFPMSLLLKLFGKRFLTANKQNTNTYLIPSNQRKSNHMEKPY